MRRVPAQTENLTPKQQQALAALIQHGTVTRAAKALQMTREKLSTTLSKVPALREAWHDAIVTSVENALIQLASQAENAVEMMLDSIATPTSPRLTAMEFKTIEFILSRADEIATKRKLQVELDRLKARFDALTQQQPFGDPTADSHADGTSEGRVPESNDSPEESGTVPPSLRPDQDGERALDSV